MKKIFSLLLCLTVLFSMAACSNDGNEENPPETPKAYESAPDTSASDISESDTSIPGESTSDENKPTTDNNTIRPNGELPESALDLTKDEVQHYTGKVMQAIIQLDVDTMEELASDDSVYLIRSVKEDDIYRTMWEKTIGKSIYLEESNMLIYKDPQYIFAGWLTDAYKNGEALKSKIDDYTEEEIIAISDKYVDKAPYIATKIDIEDDFEIDIEDGKIVIDCNDCLSATAWDELSDVGVPHPISRSGEDLAKLAFGVNCEISLGLQYIEKDGFTIWKSLITGDLSAIVAAYDAAADYDLNAELTGTNMLWETVYQHYFKKDENVSVVQQWINENVTIFREISSVYVYIPASLEKTYPYYTLTDAEKDQLKDVDIFIRSNVHEHQKNTKSEFDPFYDVIAQMVRLGAIDWYTDGEPA